MSPLTPRRLLVALFAYALGLLAAAPAADAGEYPIYACAVPGREAADQGPWVAYATGAAAFASMPTSTCGSEGWFGRSDATSMHDTYPFAGGFAGFRASVPAGRPIDIRRVQVRGTVGYVRPVESLGSMTTTVTPIERVLCAGSGECDTTWDLPFNAGTKAVTLGVNCYGGGDCTTGKSYKQQWRWAVLTASENEAPQVAADGGTLLSGGGQQGTRRLGHTASDTDSGVARVQVRLGDQLVTDHRLSDDTSRCTHRSWNACPTSTDGELDVDTTAVSDGRHAVTLTATDAAGNATTAPVGDVTVDNVPAPQVLSSPAISGSPVEGALLTGDAGRWSGATAAAPLLRWKRCDASGCETITGATGATHRLSSADVGKSITFEAVTANAIGETTTAASPRTAAVARRSEPAAPAAPSGPPSAAAPAPNGINATRSPRLVARLSHGKPTRRVRFGSTATITGTLSDEAGRPVSGASLVVSQRVRMTGAKAAPIATITTDARGAFTYRAAKGPSRELSFGYRAFSTDRDLASTTTVTILVRAAISLRTTPSKLRNGKTVRFTGTVRGRPHGKHGPLVDLQVVVHGRWRSFLRGAIRADRHGRFRASYRFLRTRRTQTYRFRAVARQDSAYPYLAATSAQRKVRVRP